MEVDQKVFVLLGTYNGRRFLAPQLHSIQQQEIQNWTLLIRDDGSDDNTPNILAEYMTKDDRITCVDDNHGHLGVVGNYGELMRTALERGADIIFLSDQDDVWLPTKMLDQIRQIEELEYKYGKDKPILVHSDLVVVNERLKQIHPSFMRYQGLAHEPGEPLRVLLVQNFITGCATAVNRPLLNLAVPVPHIVVMHDWWLGLCAGACGQIGYISTPTVLYRQHERNEIGAQGVWNLLNPIRTNWFGRWKSGTQTFLLTTVQAAELLQRIVERYGEAVRRAVFLSQQYAACLRHSRFKRVAMLSQVGIHPQGPLRQLLFWLRLLLMGIRR